MANDDGVQNMHFSQLLIDSDEEQTEDDDDVAYARSSASGTDSDTSNSEDEGSMDSWTSDIEEHDRFTFDEDYGVHADVFSHGEPIDFFKLFLDDDIMDLITAETNKYGNAKAAAVGKTFIETDNREMYKFFGMCLQMGLVKMPSLRDYWSSEVALGGHSIMCSIMTSRRFEELLRFLHLVDNSEDGNGNRLFEIAHFLELFNERCMKYYKAGRNVCIDESLVPFRERIHFRQYIPSKRHRHGIKLFKLGAEGGYTSKIKIYAGKDPHRNGPLADSVVLELMEGFLNQGRSL
ncbi:hypothetical protein V3C99_017064 [Haemonchus contortus]|uniref:DDE_Tnp_1_7 domain-containing protein n=1 Tax=Haemonchus contortus TaxID=6289 RepID=A0A7I4YZR2_HAECO|nr:similar to piggyBac-derived 2 (AGAP012114-PA) [Haemonchus contortus]